MQKMITKAIEHKAPKLYATEGKEPEEIEIIAHYFTSSFDWFMTELDPATGEAFGYVKNLTMPECSELGYFSIAEFDKYNKHAFAKGTRIIDGHIYSTPIIERDLHFAHHTLADVAR